MIECQMHTMHDYSVTLAPDAAGVYIEPACLYSLGVQEQPKRALRASSMPPPARRKSGTVKVRVCLTPAIWLNMRAWLRGITLP